MSRLRTRLGVVLRYAGKIRAREAQKRRGGVSGHGEDLAARERQPAGERRRRLVRRRVGRHHHLPPAAPPPPRRRQFDAGRSRGAFDHRLPGRAAPAMRARASAG